MKRTPGTMLTIPVLNTGMERQRSNLTPLLGKGNVTFYCDLCGLPFRTWLAWAKKNDKHYCGRGCAHAAKGRKVWMRCVICGMEFLAKESKVELRTCSRQCFSENKRRRLAEMRSRLHNAEISTPKGVIDCPVIGL